MELCQLLEHENNQTSLRHQRKVLMAAQRVGRRVNKVCGAQSPGSNLQRRQARITVKYNRKELQRRLDVEKWIDCGLDELYRGRVFIQDLVLKLQGLQKQEDLHNDGINLPQLHIYSTGSGSADREVLH
ncbi:Protein phosphatase 1 regulatory subunit 14A [Nibea albiflora]|uniref:Protein phosphatase 1 regulatory subunit 14A n=1 Tax=Nibea albiflora TaxID=240163 RepID=A0ACB7EJC2_NIBAL|nr:Protein phosphatase 1 regulatory subunit 14A [Nibea albiflora]